MTDLQAQEINHRIERKIMPPDESFSFQKAAANRVLEGNTTETGFVIVMGKYGLTYGRTSLLPYLIGKYKTVTHSKTKLDITIQPSLGSGLFILCIVYILAFPAIYISWTKKDLTGIVVSGLFIAVTYISLVTKFNKVKKTYLDFIEREILDS